MARLRTLDRLLDPRSIAVVGAGDALPGSEAAAASLFETDAEVYLVDPLRHTATGRLTVPLLSAIGSPVDAVLSFLDAERSLGVAEEAAALGAGGVVVLAAGFGEAGAEGVAREDRLRSAAVDTLAVCGPNCAGFVNAKRGIRLSGGPLIPLLAGGIGLITHSGGGIAAAMLGARERRLGFSYLISPGNEAVLDLVDYLDFLLDDPDTRTICLAVEGIRRPAAFVAAAERARELEKPLIALRLVRGGRAREIARSHTGAIVEDGGGIEAAFASLGVVSVSTTEELLDATVCFEQLDRRRWRPLRGVGVLTSVGGGAELISDLCEARQIPLPPLDELARALEISATMNPLDLVTAAVLDRHDFFGAALPHYIGHPDLDAVVLVRGLDEYFRGFGDDTIYDRFIAAADGTDKALLLASLVDSRIAEWVDQIPAGAVARARGIGALITALQALDTFARSAAAARTNVPRAVGPRPRPRSIPIASPVGSILGFADAMELLRTIGIPIAPYGIVPGEAALPSGGFEFAAPYVVKLADAPHRTEIGAVRAGVTGELLAAAVEELRSLAAERGLPSDVVVQPHVSVEAEVFVGLDTTGVFGPTIVCGVGGIHAELTEARASRLAPLTQDDVAAMLGEIDARAHVLTLHRGLRLWDAEQVAAALLAVGDLAVTAPWLQSLDVNPLVFSGGAAVAVDALCVLQPGH